jgi:hypothetical protein
MVKSGSSPNKQGTGSRLSEETFRELTIVKADQCGTGAKVLSTLSHEAATLSLGRKFTKTG